MIAADTDTGDAVEQTDAAPQQLPDPFVRDLFGMAALAGLAAYRGSLAPADVARQAWEMADAMMAARDRRAVAS